MTILQTILFSWASLGTLSAETPQIEWLSSKTWNPISDIKPAVHDPKGRDFVFHFPEEYELHHTSIYYLRHRVVITDRKSGALLKEFTLESPTNVYIWQATQEPDRSVIVQGNFHDELKINGRVMAHQKGERYFNLRMNVSGRITSFVESSEVTSMLPFAAQTYPILNSKAVFLDQDGNVFQLGKNAMQKIGEFPCRECKHGLSILPLKGGDTLVVGAGNFNQSLVPENPAYTWYVFRMKPDFSIVWWNVFEDLTFQGALNPTIAGKTLEVRSPYEYENIAGSSAGYFNKIRTSFPTRVSFDLETGKILSSVLVPFDEDDENSSWVSDAPQILKIVLEKTGWPAGASWVDAGLSGLIKIRPEDSSAFVFAWDKSPALFHQEPFRMKLLKLDLNP